MMRYSDQITSPLRASSAFRPSTSSSTNLRLTSASEGSKLSLTALWEFVVRTKTLPEGLDLDVTLQAIRDRLQSPEKEIRQYGLRVLADIIPTITLPTLDHFVDNLLDDLIANLGHIHPAVRKGALDCLKIYLNSSSFSDAIITNLLRTLEQPPENSFSSNLIAGIIIALPFLLEKTRRETKEMVIKSLTERMVQVTYQESVLKSLTRIKESLGEEKFYNYFEYVCSPKSKNDFNLLCHVYNLQPPEVQAVAVQDEVQDALVICRESGDNQDQDGFLGEIVRDTVILETEIQLNSGSAITMQIHEECRQQFDAIDADENSANMALMKVFPEETLDNPDLRKTPRRVRFGGEIVKMRTPDSDSHPSDDDPTIVITPRATKTPLIEIRYNQQGQSKSSRSHIPVRRKARSEPNSPTRKPNPKKLPLSRSSPNLYAHESSRIPRKIASTGKMEGRKKKQNPEEKSISPIPAHKPIEMFHNLTRSPESVRKNYLGTADNVLLKRRHEVVPRDVRTADTQVNPKEAVLPSVETVKQGVKAEDVKVRSGGGMATNGFPLKDFPIPVSDGGRCLTCSSSESDTVIFDKNWMEVGVIPNDILGRLIQKDDWMARLRGLEDLNRILQRSAVIELLESRAASLFHFLFSIEQHANLQSAAEESLKIVFASMHTDVLQSRLGQIVTNLCKMGSPTGVRLSILVMRRISSADFFDQLFMNSILGAKSSKIREGALQILMTISRIFPSTEIDVPKTIEAIAPLLRDRKRKVRRAALETVAALGQLGRSARILDIITHNSGSYPERDALLKAVRSRLSRKQLPAVDMDGSVRYSTPSDDSELDWISRGNASASPHNNNNSNNRNLNTLEQCNTPAKKPKTWSASALPATTHANVKAETTASSFRVENGPYRANGWKGGFWRNPPNPTHEDSESDWSRDSKDKEEPSTHNMQIWAVDPWSLTNSVDFSSPNGTIQPLYLIQQNTAASTEAEDGGIPNIFRDSNGRRSARGRSFSPPKRTHNEEPQRFINLNGTKLNGLPKVASNLHKSSSSDQIRLAHMKSYSSPSDSSSDSSRKNGNNWQKSFRSAIPIPVSSDARIRIKSRHVESSRGPLVIPAHLHREKSPTPQITPIRNHTTAPPLTITRQPSANSADSREFYPPPEPHTPTPTSKTHEDRHHSSPPDFTLVEESLDCVDTNHIPRAVTVESLSEGSEHWEILDDAKENKSCAIAPEQLEKFDKESESTGTFISDKDRGFSRESSLDRDDFREKTDHPQRTLQQNRDDFREKFHPPLPTLQRNFETTSFAIDESLAKLKEKRISKSEMHLPFDLPPLERAPSRKSINSAPLLDFSHLEKRASSPPATFKRTSLPGSVEDDDFPHRPSTPIQTIPVKSPIHTPVPKPPLQPPVHRTVPKFVRKSSVRCSRKDMMVFPDSLRPFPKAREGLVETLHQLESAEWETTMKGLQGTVRLTRHHPDLVEANMHAICTALGKHVRNLRSQVARAACLACSELFVNHRKALEGELEELAAPLLHRTADTNKFLRSDANAALDQMCESMQPSKVVAVVATRGSSHQNAIVRCAAARLLTSLTKRLGCERIFQLPKETRDKILISGANMLMEGNLDTRKHAKMMFSDLATHPNFGKAMMEAVPMCTMRHIQKTLRSLQ